MNATYYDRISSHRSRVAMFTKAHMLPAFLLLLGSCVWQMAAAHHSYAMFDFTKRVTVKGSIAKIEWKNPHVFFWLYVENERREHDLYGFESEGISGLVRHGVTKSTLAIGEEVSIEFQPLRDGRHGGRPIAITRTDGSVLQLLPSGAAAPPASIAPRSE